MYLSTLRRILKAMGAELKIVARFPGGEVVINQFKQKGRLVEEDRVEVLAFADRVTPLSDGPVRATKRKLAKLVNRLDALQAGGCTEMVQA